MYTYTTVIKLWRINTVKHWHTHNTDKFKEQYSRTSDKNAANKANIDQHEDITVKSGDLYAANNDKDYPNRE